VQSRFCVDVYARRAGEIAICFECIDKVHREHAERFAEVFDEEIKRTKPTAFVTPAEPSEHVKHGLGRPEISCQRNLFGTDTTFARYKLGGFLIEGHRQGGVPRIDDPCWSVIYGREKTPRRMAVTRLECLRYIAGIRKMVAEKRAR
jgi:hypothetical protein